MRNLSTEVEGAASGGSGSRVLKRFTLAKAGNSDNVCSMGNGIMLAPVDANAVNTPLTEVNDVGTQEASEAADFTVPESAASCTSVGDGVLSKNETGHDAVSASFGPVSAVSEVDVPRPGSRRLDKEAVADLERQEEGGNGKKLRAPWCETSLQKIDLDGFGQEIGMKGEWGAESGTAPTTPGTQSSQESFGRPSIHGIRKTGSQSFSIGSVEEAYLSTLRRASRKEGSTRDEGAARRTGGLMDRIRAWEGKSDPTEEDQGVVSDADDAVCSEPGSSECGSDERPTSAQGEAGAVAEEQTESTESTLEEEDEGATWSTYDGASTESARSEDGFDEMPASIDKEAGAVVEVQIEATPSQVCGHGDGSSSMRAASSGQEAETVARGVQTVQQNLSKGKVGRFDAWTAYKRGFVHGGLAAVGVGLVGVGASVLVGRTLRR